MTGKRLHIENIQTTKTFKKQKSIKENLLYGLPSELLSVIVDMLDVVSASSMTKTCRLFHSIIKCAKFDHLDISNRDMIVDTIIELPFKVDSIKITLQQLPFIEDCIKQHITTIHIRSDDKIYASKRNFMEFPKLSKFIIEANVMVTYQLFYEIMEYCSKTHPSEVIIINTGHWSPVDCDTAFKPSQFKPLNIKSLTLSGESIGILWVLYYNVCLHSNIRSPKKLTLDDLFPFLEELIIESYKIDNVFLSPLETFSNLRKLRINTSSLAYTENGDTIQKMVENNKNLTHLALRHQNRYNKQLYALNTYETILSSISIYPNLRLTHLDIQSTQLVKKELPQQLVKHLKHLNIINTGITRIDWITPTIESLAISCNDIPANNLEGLLNLTNLKKIEIHNPSTPRMLSILRTLPSLEHIIFRDYLPTKEDFLQLTLPWCNLKTVEFQLEESLHEFVTIYVNTINEYKESIVCEIQVICIE